MAVAERPAHRHVHRAEARQLRAVIAAVRRPDLERNPSRAGNRYHPIDLARRCRARVVERTHDRAAPDRRERESAALERRIRGDEGIDRVHPLDGLSEAGGSEGRAA